jgi:hypothetical protein
MKTSIQIISALLPALSIFAVPSTTAPQKPNIVIIFTDDQG